MTNLAFLRFKKTEVSLDWTLLKLSFQDFKIFKQIGEHNLELMKHRIEKVAQAQKIADDEFDESGSEIYSEEEQDSGAQSSSDFVDSESEEEMLGRSGRNQGK